MPYYICALLKLGLYPESISDLKFQTDFCRIVAASIEKQ